MALETELLKLSGAIAIKSSVFEDERGFFLESYNRKTFSEIGIKDDFVQDNHSFSTKGVLRGLHFQLPPKATSKLVRCVEGEILDVIVDLRKNSGTFGKWEGVTLSGENKKMLYVPAGFAHGFCVLSETAHVAYKVNEFYYPEFDSGIIWNDSDIGVIWPVANPIISAKDSKLGLFRDFVPM